MRTLHGSGALIVIFGWRSVMGLGANELNHRVRLNRPLNTRLRAAVSLSLRNNDP